MVAGAAEQAFRPPIDARSTARWTGGARVTTALAQARSALDPAVGVRLRAFRTAVRAFHAAPDQPRTIAVVGLDPGAGRSTVTAMLALLAAGFSGRRVVVIDTATPTAGPRSAPGAMPATDDAAARTV